MSADDGSVPPAVQMPSSVLYDDKFVQLTESHIILKKYYLFGQAKRIAYSDIELYGTAEDFGVNCFGIKTWGMAFSPIWWAYGGFPRCDNNFIIKVRDVWLKCGFSVKNPDQFCSILASKGAKRFQKK